MALTVSQDLNSTWLTQVTQRTGIDWIVGLLESQSSTSDETESGELLGELIAFLGAPDRLRTLSAWAAESPIARALEILGAAAAADPALMRRLRITGSDRPVARTLRGRLKSHYLVGMVAARSPITPEPGTASFIEKLRTLLLLRSLEAVVDGHHREKNLQEVCTRVRQVCESRVDDRHRWFAGIAHGTAGLEEFILESTRRADVARNTSAKDRPEREFLAGLIALLNQDWDETSSPRGASTSPISSKGIGVRHAPKRGSAAFDGVDPQAEDSPSILEVKVDPERPPTAQRTQAMGLQLQSLEDAQYLRHSWHHLSGAEERMVLDRCDSMLVGTNLRDRVGAAFTIIAALTSTPLSSLSHMPIKSDTGEDWALDLDAGELHRRSPRFSRRWRAEEEQPRSWLRPLANPWRIRLPSSVLKPLRACGRPDARPQQVSDVWNACEPAPTLEAWFGAELAVEPGLERLTSPAIPTLLAQHTFARSGDHVLAKLVSSNSRSALPAACAYASYSIHEIRGAIGEACIAGLGPLFKGQNDVANAAGSEMDVLPERLRSALAELTRRVDAAAANAAESIEHHNLLTALCVVALLASTGARIVTSPFEALTWIDFERRLIYVADKQSGPTQGSRVCVLSDFAAEVLVERYLPHLGSLADRLGSRAPEFASQVRRVVAREQECALPLFFFLRSAPELCWLEVSDAQLSAVTQAIWPLPWNLFRHMHSTQLRRWGLHPDIRDALLSHGDQGAEAHGDFSWRVPSRDLEAARPLVNRLARDLGFTLPRLRDSDAFPVLPTADLEVDRPQAFGRAARRARREAAHVTARRRARDDLEHAIGDRPPSSLSPSEWEEIARSMLFRDGNLRHPMASLRYEVVEGYLAKVWREQNVRPRMTRRWLPPKEAAALFSEEVIDAPRQLASWRQALDKSVAELGKRAPGPVLAGLLGALELALHCRVDHSGVLRAVACNSTATRTVRYAGRFWLEWAYRGEWKDGRPVYRVPVTDRAASWMSLASASSRTQSRLPAMPLALQAFAKEWSSVGEMLGRVAHTVAQQNAFELPGALSAMLSGRRESAAMPHRDWVRTREGIALANPGCDTVIRNLDNEAQAETDVFGSSRRKIDALEKDAVERCRTLFETIAHALQGSQNDGEGKPVARIEEAVKLSGFKVGEAPYIAAHYARHLATRFKKTDQGATLKPKTRDRYWSSLAPGLLDYAYALNLVDLDDEELTELYADIVDAAGLAAEGPGHAHRRALRPDTDAPERALAELIEFHAFAQKHYGLDEPDWAEVSPGCTVGGGRPGVVLPTEYRAALKFLVPTVELSRLDDLILASAFVLIICARFGLRTSEAVGLQRSDWVDFSGTVVVLVRANAVRSLKTSRSKRQVPLIEAMDDDERAVVAEVLRRWEHNEGCESSRPLLPGVSSASMKRRRSQISSTLLPLLKAVTRNPDCMVHHLRHAYASRVLALLCARDPCDGRPLTDNPETDSARRLLLGGSAADRRTLWAVSRLLGHASPATTLKSYVHVLDTWLPAPPARPPAFALAPSQPDLDALARVPDYLAGPFRTAPVLAPVDPLFVRYMRYLRQRRRGRPAAASLSRVSIEEQGLLERNFELAAAKLSQPHRRSLDELLDGIGESRWDALIRVAQSCPPCDRFDTHEWCATVGSNRQVLLFMKQHFEWAARFLHCIGPAAQRLTIVEPPALHNALKLRMQQHLPDVPTVLTTSWSKGFQLDVAVLGVPQVSQRDRVALMPRTSIGAAFASTIEMIVTWITWVTAHSIGLDDS